MRPPLSVLLHVIISLIRDNVNVKKTLDMVLKIRFPEIGSSSKSNRLFRVANSTYSANFIRIRGEHFEISCTEVQKFIHTHTHTHTDRYTHTHIHVQRWKHYLRRDLRRQRQSISMNEVCMYMYLYAEVDREILSIKKCNKNIFAHSWLKERPK